MKKVPATFEFEKSLWTAGKEFIVGIDEVGRGAWAGPLVSAAVIFPRAYQTEISFYDSKMLHALERQKLSKKIKEEAVCFGFGVASVEEIINLGLAQATQISYRRALRNLTCKPDHYLIDTFYIKELPRNQQTSIIHGDQLCATIAAASIIAKVYRDYLMRSLGKIYKAYKFAYNKGYGTKAHQKAISEFGLSEIHRTSYNLKFLYE